jgi:ATP-dependent Clp protease ATP-binding subunit ClpC
LRYISLKEAKMSKLDNFTERSIKVINLAQEEAHLLNHSYVGTEHLLLGLIREDDGVAARVLRNLGIILPKVRDSVEFISPRGKYETNGELGLTPRTKMVIDLAKEEAKVLGHHYIRTEHLLLGLIREGEGIAAGVLESLGVNLETVRQHVLLVLESKQLPASSSSQSHRPADSLNEFISALKKLGEDFPDFNDTISAIIDRLESVSDPEA